MVGYDKNTLCRMLGRIKCYKYIYKYKLFFFFFLIFSLHGESAGCFSC